MSYRHLHCSYGEIASRAQSLTIISLASSALYNLNVNARRTLSEHVVFICMTLFWIRYSFYMANPPRIEDFRSLV